MSSSSALVVLVLGFRRPRALYYVLEGLRRQGALPITEVWIDGHHEDPTVWAKVEACAALARRFPEAAWRLNGARIGIAKLLIGALGRVATTHDAVLVLEDDCFPTEDAVRVFSREIERIRTEPTTFSVYGHFLGLPGEHERSLLPFQPWGWATTTEKLRMVLPELTRLWALPEIDYLEEIRSALTPAIRERLDGVPGKSGSDMLTRRFCWHVVLGFLASRGGMASRPTPHQVVYNFGVGLDSGHFARQESRFFQPPLSMISEAELKDRFDLHPPSELVEGFRPGRLHHFSEGSRDLGLLGTGWSSPEAWGTWSVGDHATLELGAMPDGRLTLAFSLRTFVPQGASLNVDVEFDGAMVGRWTFEPSAEIEVRQIEIPAERRSTGRLVFHHRDARSPLDLGLSGDSRRLGLGLIDLRAR